MTLNQKRFRVDDAKKTHTETLVACTALFPDIKIALHELVSQSKFHESASMIESLVISQSRTGQASVAPVHNQGGGAHGAGEYFARPRSKAD